ncbi:MAG: 2Fe-2S iron-sulfur cluster binding domain-containing protein [Chloroflexi bacterium]|nr:2Fe-2S iron-sulfur cluster binding domain-containing protein [Chloroflexota bacterium]
MPPSCLSGSMTEAQTHELRILIDDETRVMTAPHGANLRRTLLDAGLSPYTRITSTFNCGGRGLCATCGVHFEAGEPAPENWHDQLAARFGYPRLSCQIAIRGDMTVRILTEKVIWGARDPNRRYRPDA